MSQKHTQRPNINIGSPIDATALQLLVGDLLSEDDGFLALSALALFSRYGVDREMRTELEQIANGLAIPVEDLLAANRKLERLGLVTKHGRYRRSRRNLSLSTSRLVGWEALGDRIIANLLPTLEGPLAKDL